MTSMLKRVDVAASTTFIKSVDEGTFMGGNTVFDLKADGVGYSTTGGRSTTSPTSWTSYKAEIIAGTIAVPTTRT